MSGVSGTDPLLFEGPLQDALHDYLTPHPNLGTDWDDRGCVPCFLIARAIAPVAAGVARDVAVEAEREGFGNGVEWADGERKAITVSAVEWADHIGSARINALRDAAVFFERDMDTAWGGGKQWLTTGTQVAELVADILREQADELDSGTRCHNGHLFTPGVSADHARGESDPRWCNTCGEAGRGS